MINAYKVLLLFVLGLITGIPSALAADMRELHVSGPCLVELVVSADSAGRVIAFESAGIQPQATVKHIGESLFVELPEDPARPTHRSRLRVYCPSDMRIVDIKGRCELASTGLSSKGDLSLVVTGPARLEADAFKAATVNVSMTGTGSITVGPDISASSVNCSLTGSGRIMVNGAVCTRLNATLRGSGKIFLSGSARRGSVVVKGSGRADCTSVVADMLDLSLYGPGTIVYKAGSKVSVSGNKDGIKAIAPYHPN